MKLPKRQVSLPNGMAHENYCDFSVRIKLIDIVVFSLLKGPLGMGMGMGME